MLKLNLYIFLLGLALAQAAIISPKVKLALKSQGTTDIMVTMREKTTPVLQQLKAQRFLTRTARLDTVAGSLKSLAAKSQKSVLEYLDSNVNIEVISLWINNRISIKGANTDLINNLASMPEIESIDEDGVIHLKNPVSRIHPAQITVPNAVQWGINTTEAPAAWDLGYTGSGVVVATIDSGVRYTHKSLYRNWRQTFGWFDPYFGSVKPNDGLGHGTHTMGTLAGSGGVGMAPEAQWIACMGCNAGGQCAYHALEYCGQFVLCPTYVNGTEAPDCSNAPHLVSNSWGADDGYYRYVVDAWEAAGIIPVFALGNLGPECTSDSTPGDFPNVIAVGATDSNDVVAEWSSVGPTDDGRIKPDVAAPGVDIISASNLSDDELLPGSGTSMACPHVAGAVALFLSNGGELTFTEVSELLVAGAQPTVETGMNCGGIPESVYPNNHVGHGRINVLASINKLREMRQKH